MKLQVKLYVALCLLAFFAGLAGAQSLDAPILKIGLTDKSGSITVGGTAQELMARNTTRRYLMVQNLSTGDLWINFGVTAVQDQPSLKLTPGSAFGMESSIISIDSVSIIGATTGQKFSAKEG